MLMWRMLGVLYHHSPLYSLETGGLFSNSSCLPVPTALGIWVHTATPGFSCVSVNQIQATTLDQQADALIQSLVCVYLCECISHVCGCWQRPKEGAGLPRTGVTHGCKLSNTGAGLHSGPLNEQQVLKLPSGFSRPRGHV